FFGELAAARTAIQYILYSADDVARYRDLRTRGVLPDTSHWVLFVLGRYSAGQHSDPTDLLQFLQAWADGGDLTANVPWAMCAFGPREAECALTAALLGGHARLGFENNMALPDGSTAPD
ncbi:3-keto-5-aminohexanoate cleavage protein, partial [Mycobacterium tuberculosis]|nr:3-keto-5-aminohexanoate cleavage protein [Mycobacterium tuberculosis]